MRAFAVIVVSLALLFAFVQAPFLHTHQHEATQRHPGTFLHLHLKSFQPAGTGREFRLLDPNDDAVFQNWFSATPTDSGLTPVILLEHLGLAAPERRAWMVEAPLQIGRAPPLLSAKSPRGPPA
jgi:hypothetical protein